MKVKYCSNIGLRYFFFQVAMSSLESALLKYSAKEYFFRAALCHLCVDSLNAQHAIERYVQQYPAFQDSREYKLINVRKVKAIGFRHSNRKFKMKKWVITFDPIFADSDRTFGRQQQRRILRGCERVRFDLATGPMVHHNIVTHKETSQRQSRLALIVQRCYVVHSSSSVIFTISPSNSPRVHTSPQPIL